MVLSIVRLIYRRINKKLCFVSLLLALDCTTFSGKTLPKNERLRKNIEITRTNFIFTKCSILEVAAVLDFWIPQDKFPCSEH